VGWEGPLGVGLRSLFVVYRERISYVPRKVAQASGFNYGLCSTSGHEKQSFSKFSALYLVELPRVSC